MKNIPYIPHGKLSGLIEEFEQHLRDELPIDMVGWNIKRLLEYFTEWLNKTGHFILTIPDFKPDETD